MIGCSLIYSKIRILPFYFELVADAFLWGARAQKIHRNVIRKADEDDKVWLLVLLQAARHCLRQVLPVCMHMRKERNSFNFAIRNRILI